MARCHKWRMNEWKTYLKVGKYHPYAGRWRLTSRWPLRVWKSWLFTCSVCRASFHGLSLPIWFLNLKNQEKIHTRCMDEAVVLFTFLEKQKLLWGKEGFSPMIWVWTHWPPPCPPWACLLIWENEMVMGFPSQVPREDWTREFFSLLAHTL